MPSDQSGRFRRIAEDLQQTAVVVLAALAIFAIVAGFGSCLIGCGATEWDIHATVATAAHDTGEQARSVILLERRQHLEAAARAAATAEDVARAVQAAAATWVARNAPVLAAVNLFIGAANTYGRIAYAAIRGQGGSAAELAAAALEVARTWEAFAAALSSNSDAEHSPIPRLPDWVLSFLGGNTAARPPEGAQ